MNLKLNPRDKLIAAGLGALLLVGLVTFFLLKPQYDYIKQLKAEQQAEQEKLDQAKLTLQRLAAVRQEVVDIEAKRILLARRVPETMEMPALIIELKRTGYSVGVKMSGLSIGQPAAQPGYSEIPISMTITGDFYSIIDFLYRLENSTREIIVDSIGISPGTYPDLSLAVQARAFMLSTGGASVPPPPPSQNNEAAPAANDGAGSVQLKQ